jgi:hypothetical protein
MSAWRASRPLLLLLTLASGSTSVARAQSRRVLHGAVLIDGRGGAPLRNSRVVIDSGRFVCVSDQAGCPARPGDRVVDLAGKWIIPGLIDTHVHLPMDTNPDGLARAQRLRFALGITTVRDGGSGAIDALLAARTVADAATAPTPRLVIAARVLPEDADRLGVPMGAPLVARLVELGVDAIKIKPPFEGGLWQAEIRAAKAAGIPAYGHTWSSPSEVFTREAIAVGINGISHIMSIAAGNQKPGISLVPPAAEDEVWPWEKRLWLTADSAKLDTLITEMIAARVWLEPTLALEYHFGRPLQPTDEVPYLQEPPGIREMLRPWRSPQPTTVAPVYPDAWPHQAAFVGRFIQRGGMVVAGADVLAPGIDLHEEMALIGIAANAPMVGLLAATRNAAIALNRPQLGTIEPGKLADAVVYASDPLRAPRASLLTERVIKGGEIYDAEVLRAEFREEYQAKVRKAWRGRLQRGGQLAALPALLLTAALWVVWSRRRRRRA